MIFSTIISEVASAEAIYFIIEDEYESACRVLVPVIVNTSQFVQGINLVILNPYYQMASDGRYTLVVKDHSDLCLLNVKSPLKSPGANLNAFSNIPSLDNSSSSNIKSNKLFTRNDLNLENMEIEKTTDLISKNVADPFPRSLKITDSNVKVPAYNPFLLSSTDVFSKSEDGYYNELGRKSLVECRYVQAIAQFSCAIQANPGEATFYENRAFAYFKLEYFEDALVDFEKSKSLKPDFALYHYLVALMHGKIGNHVSSLDLLKKIKTKDNIEGQAIKKLIEKEEGLVKNVMGEFDFDELRESTKETKKIEIGDYIGPITIQSSTKHGRGIFTTRDVRSGENLCVTQAIYSHFLVGSIVSPCPCRKCREQSFSSYKSNSNMCQGLIEKLRKSKLLTVRFFNTCDTKKKAVNIDLYCSSGYELSKIIDTSQYPLNDVPDLFRNYPLYHDHYVLDKYSNRASSTSLLRHLWLLPYLINHSCIPNTVLLYFENICIVRAISDIPKGSEIFVSYLPLAVFPDVQARSDILKFKCDCNLCAFERHHEHEQEISQLLQLESELKNSISPEFCLAELLGLRNSTEKKIDLSRKQWLRMKDKSIRLVKLLELSNRPQQLVCVSFQSIMIRLFEEAKNKTDALNLVTDAEAYFSELDPETYVAFWTTCYIYVKGHLDPTDLEFRIIKNKFEHARKLFT